MKKPSIALMIYGEPGSGKSVFTEEKYKKLAAFLCDQEFTVDSVLYHDTVSDKLEKELNKYDAILVWVNPVEQGHDRTVLDALLIKISAQGCFVSAHPDTILKMGTKEILYRTRDEEFGSRVKIYYSFRDFKDQFLQAGDSAGIRILKKYRGNGGNGVYKTDTTHFKNNRITITHALSGDKEEQISIEDFFKIFENYFKTQGILIDQEWNPNIVNGMVRCYLCGTKVAGFGYQEVNILYPVIKGVYKKPSQRFYYSEDCGLFRDLKLVMETRWVPRLQVIAGVDTRMLPVIWDADFFINKVNSGNVTEKYTLCEINASSVSPFPESAVPYITEEVSRRIYQ